MKPLRITIILPFPVAKPVGGAKIMYEYANRLHEKGHEVQVLHSIRRPYKKMRSPLWLKQLMYAIKQQARPKWFPLNKLIVSKIVPEITDRYLPDADIVLSTWWQMTYAISKLSPSKGIPFNLIQGYEIWLGNEELVHASYSLPVHHLVIADYLSVIVKEHSGKMPRYLPLAIDTKVYYVVNRPENRKPASVLMIYSKEEWKGSKYGIEALVALRKEIPDLKATLFGVHERPDLPDWITYHQQPSNLAQLYNEHAIYLSPSLREGWALPPAEALACGCALCCSDIGGHAGYAIDHQTALTFPVKDANVIREKLKLLIKDDALRVELAQRGNKYLSENYNWDQAIEKLEKYFSEAFIDSQV